MSKGKCVTYSRVSTDDGRQHTENQVEILRDMAARLNLEIQREYVDHATGGNSDRPEFQRLLKDSQKFRPGQVTLLFFALDRLTREGALKTLEYLNGFDKAGVAYISATEPFLDSAGPFKDAIISIMATLAKQEKARIGERTRAGLARVRREGSRSGKPIGRPVIQIDVALARQMREDMGMSVAAIARKMNVPVTTLKAKLNGKWVKKLPPIWSEPVSGRISEDGFFLEEETGDVVIRYDRVTGKPHCLNHKVELDVCRGKHVQQQQAVAS